MATACVLVYLPALWNGLVWDDMGTIPHEVLAKNGATRGTATVREHCLSLLRTLSRGFWYSVDAATEPAEDGVSAGFLHETSAATAATITARTGVVPYYRPFVTLTLGVDWLIGGGRAWWFHLVNLVLHGLVVFLLFRLIFESIGVVSAAAAGALCFGLHRLWADSVAYVSGRTDLLLAIGLLIAALGLLRYTVTGMARWMWLVMAGFSVGVFAKESGLGFLPVAVGWLVGMRSLKRSWPVLGGLLVVTIGYLVARRMVLGSVVGLKIESVPALGLLALNSAGFLLYESLKPFNGHLFLWSPSEFLSLTWWSIPTAVFILSWGFLRRRNAGLFPWTLIWWEWVAVFLLPFAGFFFFGPLGRLMYVPGLGMAGLAAVVVASASRWRTGQRLWVALLAGWCVLVVPSLWQRIGWWRSSTAVFRRMVQDAPGFAPGFYNLGTELARMGDTVGAVGAFRQAVKLDPEFVSASLNLGALLLRRGELEEAETVYRRVANQVPGYAPVHVNWGIVRFRLGDVPGAIVRLRRAVELAPHSISAAYNLGWLYRLHGESDSASAWAARAWRLVQQQQLAGGRDMERVRRLYNETRRERAGLDH